MTPFERQQFFQEFYAHPHRAKLVSYLQDELAALREEHEDSAVGNDLVRGKIQLVKEFIKVFDKG